MGTGLGKKYRNRWALDWVRWTEIDGHWTGQMERDRWALEWVKWTLTGAGFGQGLLVRNTVG